MLTNLKLGRPVKSFNPGASPFPTSVPGENLLAVPPVNRTVMEGESVRFDCVAKGEKSVVSWFREGVKITAIEVTRPKSSQHIFPSSAYKQLKIFL